MSILKVYNSVNKILLSGTIFFVATTLLAQSPAYGVSSGASGGRSEVQAESSANTRGNSASNRGQTQRQDTYMGTGNAGTGGFSSTYTDPQTGDVITRIVPPADPNPSQVPPVPIYIFPQVEPQWPPKHPAQPLPVLPSPSPANPSLYNPNGN